MGAAAAATRTLYASPGAAVNDDVGALWNRDPGTQTYAAVWSRPATRPPPDLRLRLALLAPRLGGRAQPGRRGRRGGVTTAPGRAVGYRRCWANRSADHRGTPSFNGIVCTLLSDGEVRRLQSGVGTHEELSNGEEQPVSTTKGLIYTIDSSLAERCLAELDFREKGGYARDVVDVVEDDTGD